MINSINNITKNEEKNKLFDGMPGMVLLPARNYRLKTIVEGHWFSVPFSGKFSEMYPDFFEETNKNEDTDGFNVVFDRDAARHVSSVNLVEALFASSKYPALEDNQIFAIISMSLSDDKKMLYVKGSVLEICD